MVCAQSASVSGSQGEESAEELTWNVVANLLGWHDERKEVYDLYTGQLRAFRAALEYLQESRRKGDACGAICSLR